MLDIGWSELLVIGLLALLVVGPKELPGLLRTIGQYVGKARSMAREFQRSMEDAAREADLGELTQLKDAKRELDKLARVDFSEQAKRSQSFMGGGEKKTAEPAEAKPAESAPPAKQAASTESPPPAPTEAAAAEPEAAPAPKAQGDKA